MKVGLPGTDGGGSWYCFESGTSGGVFALIEREAGLSPENKHAAAVKWLRDRGLIPAAVERSEQHPPEPPPHSDTASPAETHSTSRDDTDLRAARLWAAARPADEETLAHTYLIGRKAWPPGVPLPGAVRWIDRTAWPGDIHPKPPGGAGAILYRFTVAGGNRRDDTRAVQAEALDAPHGKPLPIRWRRCIGSKKRNAFALVGRGFNGPVVVCEGEVDALACLWLRPDASLIMAAGGSAGVPTLAPALAELCRGDVVPAVEFEPDGDAASFTAGVKLIRALSREALAVCVHPLRPGSDPAEDLRQRIEARLARNHSLSDAWAPEVIHAE